MTAVHPTILNTDLFARIDYDAITGGEVYIPLADFTRPPTVGEAVAIRDPQRDIAGAGTVRGIRGEVAKVDIGWFYAAD